MPRQLVAGLRTAAVEVVGNANQWRMTLAWGAFFLIDSTTLIALSVWAFREDGASAVALIGVARLLPGALALPFGAWAADRFPRRRVMITVYALEALALTALAVVVATDPPIVAVAVMAGLVGVIVAPYRPAHLAISPLLANSAEELMAGNVASGAMEGLCTLAGPLVAAGLLVAGDAELVLGVAAVGAVIGLVAVWGVRPVSDPSAALRHSRSAPLHALLGGFVTLWHDRAQGLIVACFVMQLLVRGLLSVELVVVAFDRFDMGSSGVGWLNAAIGVGALIGSAVTFTLAGRRRLAVPFAIGLVLWGAPIAVLAGAPNELLAMLILAVLGVGNAVLDVSGFTMLQRFGDDKELARVFGALFTVGVTISAGGAAIAPVLIDVVGLRPALLITGAVLPVTSLVAYARLRSIDARNEPNSEAIAALRELDLVGALPPVTVEKMAARSHVVEVAAGEAIVTEGEPSDAFYVVLAGEASVTKAGVALNALRDGDHFGEIGLLAASQRTATVRSISPMRLLALSGPAFVDAMTGNQPAFTATSTVIDARLRNDAEAGLA